MKKLLILGVSACLLFTFSGSAAFAASNDNTHNTKKSVHASKSPKSATVHKEKSAKNQIHNAKHSNPITHKKTLKTAPKK